MAFFAFAPTCITELSPELHDLRVVGSVDTTTPAKSTRAPLRHYSCGSSLSTDNSDSSSPPEEVYWRNTLLDSDHGYITQNGIVLGLTQNLAATYISSGNACVDFFFQVVGDTPKYKLVELLENAWTHNPLQALKLVYHLRGVRGTGKSDKGNFYIAAVWLQTHHPATLRHNLALIADFGYFKDLLELVLRLVEGPEETERKTSAKAMRKRFREDGVEKAIVWKALKTFKKENYSKEFASSVLGTGRGGYYGRKGAAARAARKDGTLKPKEERIAASIAADQAAKTEATALRRERKLALASAFADISPRDSNFQTLYLEVAKVFADRLKQDLKALEEGRVCDISLAAKWAPSLNSSFDLRTLLCDAIASKIFPKEDHPEYEEMNNRKYAFTVRERFRKDVLVPLRKELDLPEVYMSAQKWGEVKYPRVASVAMKNYKEHFLKHDKARFQKYLEDEKSCKARIAAGALLPHEILRSALVTAELKVAKVAELQWKGMVEDLQEIGSLGNCIAVCDVSGSMEGEPMVVCIALGMLLSDLSDEPWKGHVITFSSNPEIHFIKGDSLFEKYSFIKSLNWGMNTNFQLVLNKVLEMAQSNNLAPEKMIKRLFVFSDIEFDHAVTDYKTNFTAIPWNLESSVTNSWEIDYAAIYRKFEVAGYGFPPEIVFWNLRDTKTSTPVMKWQTGVTLVSGFSKNILKIFLQNDGKFDPVLIMEDALEGKEYSQLKIVD